MSTKNSRRSSSSRGLVESTQWALLIPLLLTAIFAVIQASIWFSGRSIVQQAAMAGAEQAAFANTGFDSAEDTARQVATRGGLNQISIQTSFNAQIVQVQVTARPPALLPGPWASVSASAQRIKEGS